MQWGWRGWRCNVHPIASAPWSSQSICFARLVSTLAGSRAAVWARWNSSVRHCWKSRIEFRDNIGWRNRWVLAIASRASHNNQCNRWIACCCRSRCGECWWPVSGTHLCQGVPWNLDWPRSWSWACWWDCRSVQSLTYFGRWIAGRVAGFA